ncbi:acyltransferase domain-containing protein [Streptomyces olivaceiscleroticus]|uniref:Malonyl-CoA:ACP transacylase (MAT) domain-containing protein n=1 Tax=Streptomyces olivaceiscleroticus TaxID=68245 RepID=A0ABN1BCP2_9ACTN
MSTTNVTPGDRRVALLFPGQGAQHPRMAAGLHGWVPAFTMVMEEAFALLGEQGEDLRAEWLAADPSDLFDDVTRSQPLLYAVGYALGRAVLELGVEPVALLGHSVGEMVAATLADVLSFADGIRLMRDRVAQYADTPPGGMLAVAASADEVAPFLTGCATGDPVIAAVNAPQQTLVAGGRSELAELTRKLRAHGHTCMAARARQAFHSPLVADAAERSLNAWQAVPLCAPTRRVYSVHARSPLGPDLATDPRFWAMQPTATVHFWPMLDRLLAEEDVLLVEAGPGQGLTTLARRHPAVRSGRSAVLPLLPARPDGAEADRAHWHAAVAGLTAEL